LSFLAGLLAGAVVAAVVSLAVSIPSVRLRDDYFVIASFAFQMIAFSVFNNWIELTRGPMGIFGVPPPDVFGWAVSSLAEFALLVAVFAGFAFVIVARIAWSPFGRVLRAIREDEIFTQVLGKNTGQFKVIAFAVSAALAAVAGGLYAHYITFIDPTSFTVMESILVIAMVIIGGAGSLWGALLGAVVLVTLPEILRLIGLPPLEAAIVRQIIYGMLLVVMMMVRPKGLVGRYGFER
jgi:branched-chain amino acid transport system permease protein